jgi:CheY-like chemotaxis protein
MTKNATILVVDDEPDIRTITARVLRSAGYEVFEAGTGSEALSIAEDRKPNVILPDMDGIVNPLLPGFSSIFKKSRLSV